MNLTEIFAILFIHWIADFVCQTDWQAKNKSKDNYALLSHTTGYSLVWFMAGLPFYSYAPILFFAFIGITFVAHTITDYYTSRLNSKLWAAGKVHYFFVSVGFDQILHYVQLFTTYYLLK